VGELVDGWMRKCVDEWMRISLEEAEIDGFFGLVRQAHHRWLRTSLGDFGFATGGFYYLTNMTEGNHLRRLGKGHSRGKISW